MKYIKFLVLGFSLGAVFAGCGGTGADQSAEDPEEAFLAEMQEQAESAPALRSGSPGTINPDGDKMPQIELPYKRFNMGMIPGDRNTTKEMKIYNRGDVPLNIFKVTTSCNCTMGKMRDPVIPPGGEGVVDITLNPFRVPGFESLKTLTFFSDDPLNPMAELDVYAEIEPELDVVDGSISIEVKAGQAGEGRARVRQSQDTPLEIRGVKVRPLDEQTNYFEVSAELVPEEEWADLAYREYDLIARIAPAAPAGNHDAVLTMLSNLRVGRALVFPIFAKVRGAYRIEPEELQLREVEPGETLEGAMELTADFPVEEFQLSNENTGIVLEVRRSDDHKSVVVDLLVPDRPENRLQKDTWTVEFKLGETHYKEELAAVVLLTKPQS